MCSSDFIKQTWITLLFGFDNSINNHQKLDRPLLSKYLQILAWLCGEATILAGHWKFIFSNRVTLDNSLFTQSYFKSYLNDILDAIKRQAPAYFQVMIPFITEVFESSLFPTGFNTDWTPEFGNASNGYLIQNIPRLYMNNTCNCVVSNSCQNYLRVGPSNLVLPGLVVGCTPIDGLRMSTLECFYSSDCISTIINHLEYYTEIDGSPPTNFTSATIPPITIRPLDKSIQSRFLANSSIDSLIYEMFIENWITTTSYENYFRACVPETCRYQYTKRQDIIYIALSLLALYGGLTVGWRLIIWNGLILCQWIKRRYLTRHTTVRPVAITEQS